MDDDDEMDPSGRPVMRCSSWDRRLQGHAGSSAENRRTKPQSAGLGLLRTGSHLSHDLSHQTPSVIPPQEPLPPRVFCLSNVEIYFSVVHFFDILVPESI